jgi:hypothetical protein
MFPTATVVSSVCRIASDRGQFAIGPLKVKLGRSANQKNAETQQLTQRKVPGRLGQWNLGTRTPLQLTLQSRLFAIDLSNIQRTNLRHNPPMPFGLAGLRVSTGTIKLISFLFQT